MAGKTSRKIIHIDEEKCNGCGACVTGCVESALRIVDGKAKLISETYCDGLGACLGECPQGALTVIERDAEEFDEVATARHMALTQVANREQPCACPSAAVRTIEQRAATAPCAEAAPVASQLQHWPVQLTLVPPTAAFLKDADVLLTAHCVPFAYGGFHQEMLAGHAVLAACPKLDDFQAHLDKLTKVLKMSGLKSLTVVHMEVPCCSGLVYMAKQAMAQSGVDVPLRDITIGIQGEVKE